MTITHHLLDEVAALLPESTLIEYIEGTIIVNPPPTFGHARIVARTRDWLASNGIQSYDGVGIATPDGGWVIPDLVAFHPDAELDSNAVVQPLEHVALVVEVLSPSTARRDYGYKRELYAGRSYLIIDDHFRTIAAHDVPGDLDVDDLTATLWGDWQQ